MRKSKKILIIAILAVVMLSLVIGGGITVWAMRREEIKDMNNSEIAEVLLASESSLGWVNGEKVNIDHETLNEVLSEMLEGCRLMPAFGVALDNEVKEARKTGVWLELEYAQTIEFAEMTFNKLLIEVGADYTGFNVMRHHEGAYEGRCYYVDLVDNNMSELYNYLTSLK